MAKRISILVALEGADEGLKRALTSAERSLGELSTTANPHLLDRNSRRIASLVATGKIKKRDRDFRPAAGTLLTREYRGVAYRVAVTADGQYEFEGRMFPSLSMIAREITGTRWSGPVFFGLKPISTPKPKATKGVRR
jgi:hypothetical protein